MIKNTELPVPIPPVVQSFSLISNMNGTSTVSSAKLLGTITPIMATATSAMSNTGFNIIFKHSQYL